MAKILLTTFGSYGDLHPYLAMARALVRHGHRVVLASHSHYREFVERVGAEFVAVKPGFEDLGPEEEWAPKVNDARGGTEFIIRHTLMPYLEESYETFHAAAEGCDLIISHILTMAAPLVAEKRGIPWLSCALQPVMFLSAYDPPALPPMPWLPRLKFLGPCFFRPLFWLASASLSRWLTPVHALRKRLGLPASSANPLTQGFSPHGTLALFPHEFAAPQRDWPPSVWQVGFPLFDQETTHEASPAVRDFLTIAPAPVVFTLGSAVVRMATPFYHIAYDAVRQLGLRAIFLVGKEPRDLPVGLMNDSEALVSGYEPFSALFPHAQAIVHQCGIGTTAQALAAGRPQVLVPFAHDQFDNARRVEQLGLGLSLPSSSLNVSRLRAALQRVTEQTSFRAKARQYATQLPTSSFETRLLEVLSPFVGS